MPLCLTMLDASCERPAIVSGRGHAPDRTTREEVTAFFTRHWEAFNRRDVATLAADYLDDCIVESPTAGTITGRSAVKAVNIHWFAAFPDITISSDEIMSVGDRVVESITVRGTDTGGFLNQPPTGKPFEFKSIILYRLDQGRIVHERRVWDLYGLMAQLTGTQSQDAGENPRMYRATLERARMERELKVAADIQRALLPDLQRSFAGFEVAAASVPCRAIGGDFFDYYDYGNGSFAFCLGDVAGKGPPAALLAAELQGILAALSQRERTPADIITGLNRVRLRHAVDARFATLVYGLVDDNRLTYCNAGHNPPLLVGRDRVQWLSTGGPIVGAFEHVVFDEATVELDEGDVLVVYSDGITEAENPAGSEFGEEGLLSLVEAHRELPPGQLLQHLVDCVKDFTVSDMLNDDRTALILRYSGNSNP
jgi:steroid delta-isomerase-like uncharacterized protein